MFNLTGLSNILVLFTEVAMAVVSLYEILKSEKAWQKLIAVLLLLVASSSFLLNFYLQINSGSISAKLHIGIYQPMVINVNGSEVDKFVDDANYRVLCATAYPLNTKFSIVLTNTKTLEKNEYVIYDVYNGGYIGEIDSGNYKVDVYINSELKQSDKITLSSDNLDDNAEWPYTVYIMNDFYSYAIKNDIVLGKENYEAIEIPTFSISLNPSIAHICELFETNFLDQSGTFEGEFYFGPGTYYLNNAVRPSSMEAITINVG